MPRRPLAALVALLLAAASLLLVAGCGSGDKKSSASGGDATAAALSYFPADSGLVALIDTDPNGAQIKNVEAILKRFPGSGVLLDQLKSQIEKTGVDYETDVKPLLGNDLAVGSSAPGGLDTSHLLIALVANDESKLKDLVEGQVKKGKAKKAGEHAGATLYTDSSGDTVYAVEGANAVIGDNAAAVNGALDRHDDGSGLKKATVEAALTGLPGDGLVRVYGNAKSLLTGSAALIGRAVPWVGALGQFAVTAKAQQDSVDLDLRLDTSAGSLTDDDLPIAPGSASPPLAGDGDILVGLHDPSHLIDFVQRTAQAISPSSFQTFAAAKVTIKNRLGVDLDRDVIAQLTGDAQLSTDLDTFQIRFLVRDPAAMTKTLDKLAPVLPDFLAGAGSPGTKVRKQGDAYVLTRGGDTVLALAVIGKRLVVSTSSAADLEQFAKAADVPLDGAKGSLALKVKGDKIKSLIGDALGIGPAANVILGALGDVTGWFEASPKALTGHLSLAIK